MRGLILASNDSILTMAKEVFAQIAGDQAPTLALVKRTFPLTPLRYEACLFPVAEVSVNSISQVVRYFLNDEENRPDGFSELNPDSLEFTYTQRFWHRKKKTFIWDYAFQGIDVPGFFQGEWLPDFTYNGYDAQGIPDPEQVTLYLWWVFSNGRVLFPIASLYDGYPQRVNLDLDEWSRGHYRNPRMITADALEITELVGKVKAAGGEFYEVGCDVLGLSPYEMLVPGFEGQILKLGEEVKLPDHVLKYVERSPDLMVVLGSMSFGEYLAIRLRSDWRVSDWKKHRLSDLPDDEIDAMRSVLDLM